MSPIDVVNKRNGGKGIYIGRGNKHNRGSPLGNPFKMQQESDRGRVVQQYKKWLTVEMKEPGSAARQEVERIAEFVKRGQKVSLVCWCSPRACHGDVIKQTIEDMLNQSHEATVCVPIPPKDGSRQQSDTNQKTTTVKTKRKPAEMHHVKRIRKIRKLLRQISDLNSKYAETLNDDQLKKIESEPTLKKELELLEKMTSSKP